MFLFRLHLRQNNRLVLCDDDRVLKLRSNGLVNCLQGPAILFFNDASLASGEERFNGQNQPFVKNAAVIRFVKIKN